MAEQENEKITQAEFNQMVNDNMRDYQLSREDSVKEVREHLEGEGEDLSSIFIALTDDDYEKGLQLDKAFKTIKRASEKEETLINAMFEMQTIRAICQSTKLGDMAKSWFGSREGVLYLSRLLKPPEDEEDDDEKEEEGDSDEDDDKSAEYSATFKTIAAACTGHPATIQSLPEEFFENVVANLEETVLDAPSVTRDAMEVLKICCAEQFPTNKVNFVESDGLNVLGMALKAHGRGGGGGRTAAAAAALVCEAAAALQTGYPAGGLAPVRKALAAMLVEAVARAGEGAGEEAAAAPLAALKRLGGDGDEQQAAAVAEACGAKGVEADALAARVAALEL